MNINDEINQAGLIISLVGDQLKVENAERLTDRLRILIRSNKNAIVSQLSKTHEAKANELQQDIRDRIEERAAIMEYDGGLSRADAEQAAAAAIRVYCYRTTEKPSVELVAIMPGIELEEATESLRLRYGDRLLDVYKSPQCTTAVPPSAPKH